MARSKWVKLAEDLLATSAEAVEVPQELLASNIESSRHQAMKALANNDVPVRAFVAEGRMYLIKKAVVDAHNRREFEKETGGT